MKIKLKEGVKLTSTDNHFRLDLDVWKALNQGKTVELEKVPKQIEDQIIVVGGSQGTSKKTDGGKK